MKITQEQQHDIGDDDMNINMNITGTQIELSTKYL